MASWRGGGCLILPPLSPSLRCFVIFLSSLVVFAVNPLSSSFCALPLLSFYPVLVFAANQIPPELVKMAEEFQSKVDSGQARKASSGFSGKGFTFDDSEQSESQQVNKYFTR